MMEESLTRRTDLEKKEESVEGKRKPRAAWTRCLCLETPQCLSCSPVLKLLNSQPSQYALGEHEWENEGKKGKEKEFHCRKGL